MAFSLGEQVGSTNVFAGAEIGDAHCGMGNLPYYGLNTGGVWTAAGFEGVVPVDSEPVNFL